MTHISDHIHGRDLTIKQITETHTGAAPDSDTHYRTHTGAAPDSDTHYRTHTGAAPDSDTHCRTHTGAAPDSGTNYRTHRGAAPDSDTHYRTHTGAAPNSDTHYRTHTGAAPDSDTHCRTHTGAAPDTDTHCRTHRGAAPDSETSRLNHTFGIRETALNWFRSYLSGRKQFVLVGDHRSSESPLKYGVPQGSVLGPVLFILYTTPLSDVIRGHSVSHEMFADDTQLLHSSAIDDYPTLTSTLQSCTSDVDTWMSANKLKLNCEKTEAVRFYRQPHHSPDLLPLL